MKFVVIILMFLFISNSQPFVELYKLPLLVQHYSKHKRADTSLSLFGFLKLHYSKESKNDNDDNEDNRLPFKSLVENSTTIYLSAAKDFILFIGINGESSFNSASSSWQPLGLISSIFHPPCYS